MINAVEKSNNSEFLRFCDRDVFGTRIKAYYNCYSSNYDFVKFWVQTDDSGMVKACIGRIDGDMTLTCDNDCDMDELKEFILFVGFTSLQCEGSAASRLQLSSSLDGYVVRYGESDYVCSNVEVKNDFQLKEIYDIIKSANLVGIGEYLPWLSDTKFRMDRGVTHAIVAELNGVTAGCAMALFETDKACLLGAVATVPEYRGRGIAGALVTSLAKESLKKSKRTELLCKKDSIVRFYESIGFKVVNEWSIIINEAGLF